MPSDRNVFIALPAFGQTNTTHTTHSLMDAGKALIANGYDWYFSDYSYPFIDDARNMLATLFLDKSQADWMLMVDADMRFPPHLVLDMLKFGKPVMGCLYPKKTYPIQFVGSWGVAPKTIQNGFMRVDRIGFGVTMVHRGALEGMVASGEAKVTRPKDSLADFGLSRLVRAFNRIPITEDDDLAEDYSFCDRHTSSGGEVWANISHQMTHVGQHGYTGRFADQIVVVPNRNIGSAA